MPILPAEPDHFPDDLWTEANGTQHADSGWLWWCLHTKPRQEKAIARELRIQKIPYFLPLIVHEDRTPKGRKTRSVLPLFTSYLFLRGGDHERLLALRGNRLVRVIEVLDQERMDRDLRQIHRMLSSGLVVLAEPSPPVGARMRILDGPLTGVEGRVFRRGNRDRFVALVHFLGSGAMVELENWQVEQLPENEENSAC